MRLIDADELIKAIEQSRNNNPHKDCCIKRIHDIEHNTSMSGKVIRAQGAAQRNDGGVCEENIWEEENQR